jgi:hypothetical protein
MDPTTIFLITESGDFIQTESGDYLCIAVHDNASPNNNNWIQIDDDDSIWTIIHISDENPTN